MKDKEQHYDLEVIDDDEAPRTTRSNQVKHLDTRTSKTNNLLSFEVSNFGPDFFCNSPGHSVDIARTSNTPNQNDNVTPSF